MHSQQLAECHLLSSVIYQASRHMVWEKPHSRIGGYLSSDST